MFERVWLLFRRKEDSSLTEAFAGQALRPFVD